LAAARGEPRLELARARADGIHPVAIAVINPGNPTGAVLTRENIAMVIRFARASGLAILADEVYQENVYTPERRFHSFAKGDARAGREVGVAVQLPIRFRRASWASAATGGGYVEFRNIPDDVLAELVKLQSISLCSGIVGQIAVY